jgi:predicted enzyme related to lactoylglutathione lyase
VELVQSRIVTRDVERLAWFYAELLNVDTVVNGYYVEVPTTGQRVGISRVRFSDFEEQTCGSPKEVAAGEVILDFAANDIDAEFRRIEALGVHWVMRPTLQPWGRRSMMFRDPEEHLINVFSNTKEGQP